MSDEILDNFQITPKDMETIESIDFAKISTEEQFMKAV